MTKRPRKALLLLVAVIMALALPAATVVAQESGTTIAEGFNSPQGILVDPDGNIWVIDSGVGGDTEFESVDAATGETITGTYGETARVVMIAPDGTQTEVATLPSVLVGEEATGGGKLAYLDGEIYATSGVWIGNGDDNPAPDVENMAAVVKIGLDGTVEEVAPLWRLEKRMNPDNTIYESHPYGLAASPDGKLWVADAGANTIVRVDPATSVVELITTFPAIPGVFPNPARGGEMLTDPVPTDLDFDDDGVAYVSLLSGAPFVPGSAGVTKVTAAGARTPFATNMTMLTDITRGPDGAFYAVQFAVFTDQGPTPNSGAIIKVGEGETSEVVVDGLSFPTSIGFDADGNAYITINGAGAPGSGAVVKYDGVGNGETYVTGAAVVAEATAEATEEPTEEPTEEATEEPTEEPTEEATEEPTEEATEEPTEEATEEPTEEATEEPTEEATEEPTEEATEEPTEEATEEPTEEATPEPTEEATPEPTEEATVEAAAAATAEPTEEATEEATVEATEEATPEATEEATEEPTEEPTEEATAEATEEAAAVTDEAPIVEAADQESDGTQVTVERVVSPGAGWMVIHADADGEPGPVLGQTAVAPGETENVIVMLDEPVDPGTPLWAMLHVDEGVQGTYEFPGPDVPVEVDGAIVMVPFSTTGDPVAAATPEATEEATPEATEEATEEPTEEATPEATAEATEEATPEATEEATEEATMEATEEATEEAWAESTAEATEEAAEEATAAAGEKGAESAPASLPSTGAALPSLPSVIAVVMSVLAMLAGGVSIRRRK